MNDEPFGTVIKSKTIHNKTGADMAITKVIEVIASSDKSFDDATENVLKEASKSVNNITSIYIKEMNANVTDNQIVSYGVNAKVSFEVRK